MNIFGTIVLVTGLGINSVLDIWKKQISVPVTVLMGIFGIGMQVYENVFQMESLISFIPGIAGFLLAWMSKEQVGYGDGLLLLAIGCFLDWSSLLGLCMLALSMACVYSIILFFVFKKNKKYEFPFAPFLLTGFCIGRWLL